MIIRYFLQFQAKSRCRIEPLVVPCLSRFHRKLSATNRPPMRLPGNMCRYRQLLPQNIIIRNIRDLISPRRHRYKTSSSAAWRRCNLSLMNSNSATNSFPTFNLNNGAKSAATVCSSKPLRGQLGSHLIMPPVILI